MKICTLIHADPLFDDALQTLTEQRRAVRPLPLIVNGLAGGGADAFLAEAARTIPGREGCPLLILAPDENTAVRTVGILNDAGVRALRFPARDLILYEYTASHDTERERLFVLSALLSGSVAAVVATPGAAAGFLPPPESVRRETLNLRVGEEAEPDDLCLRLTALGYARCELVESAGQFARRGGILDLYPQAESYPVRIEFFGDEIDRICHFDPLTQRVTENCGELTLLPAQEVLTNEAARRAVLAAVRGLEKGAESSAGEELKREAELLNAGQDIAAKDKYLSLIYPDRHTLLDYFPEKTPVLILGTNEVNQSLRHAIDSQRESAERLIARGLSNEKLAVWSLDERGFSARLDACVPIHLNIFSAGTFRKEGGLYGFRCRRLPAYREGLKSLTDDVRGFLSQGYTVYLVSENHAGAEATCDYLRAAEIPVTPLTGEETEPVQRGAVYSVIDRISGGFDLITPRIAVLSLSRDEGRENRRPLSHAKRRRHKAGETILSYAELRPGDYVVHEKYGIGVFEGMERITQDGLTRDYITLRYAGTDKLFVPADRLESISKYIGGGEDREVRLSRLGTTAWSKTKQKAQGAAKEMAQELIRLYAARERKPGIRFAPQEAMETEFAGNFPYELTEPQEAATAEILADMEKPVPMDRLLCGDVGFGKTEVALRAAFRAIADGYQVAILVPTTILALQHYQTALARMRGFAVGVDMLSRFRTPKEQAAILRRLARGETDLVIGTHSLLAAGVKFRNLGLLIIDEEQRFGVAQKERIKSLAQNIDVLTLSATPIPRTLNMAMSGIRDMSVLDEAPGDRQPVQTYVMEYNEDAIDLAIARELARGGQVLYLYNRTEDIDLVAGKLRDRTPGARVAFAHGKMEREEIEGIWESLVAGEIDILVCTTIVETGVDLPNANTMIIENADRLGLAQLHQLRGRIGRSSRRAYAYFTYRPGKVLTDIAYKRLTAIREYAEFGAGFRIALRDLEIRGAGDLLGASQHGHIESVGYDLYVRLLGEAVLEEQGKTPPPPFESTVSIRADANIPTTYIPEPARRMEMYKKISCIATPMDRDDVLDEFCDRFGEPPVEVLRLLNVALTRAAAQRAHIREVTQNDRTIRIVPERVDPAVWAELFHRTDRLQIPSAKTPYLIVRIPSGSDPAATAAEILTLYETVAKEIQEEAKP